MGERAGGRFVSAVAFVLLAAVGLGGLAPTPAPIEAEAVQAMSKLGLIASLGLAIAGLVCIEQLLRRVPIPCHRRVAPKTARSVARHG